MTTTPGDDPYESAIFEGDIGAMERLMRSLAGYRDCWCVLGESPWCPGHHPELAGVSDDEKIAAKAAWDAAVHGR